MNEELTNIVGLATALRLPRSWLNAEAAAGGIGCCDLPNLVRISYVVRHLERVFNAGMRHDVEHLTIPRLPPPNEIKGEIRRLKARIGELRAMLRLAEAQHIEVPAVRATAGEITR